MIDDHHNCFVLFFYQLINLVIYTVCMLKAGLHLGAHTKTQ